MSSTSQSIVFKRRLSVVASDDNLYEIIDRANALTDIERYPEAVVLYENALSIDPNNAYVMTCLAWPLRMLDNVAGCKEYAERAIQSDPEFEWPYRELAWLSLQSRDVHGAYKLAKTSVQLGPENIDALHLLGHCALALERYEEVRAHRLPGWF